MVVMANRPDVKRAPAPIVAVDTVLLAEQMIGALLRVPARRPLRGPGSPVENVAYAVTREVVRSFMGYASSLPLPEFRSIELVIDDLCKVVMPPVVRALDVNSMRSSSGAFPGCCTSRVASTPKA